MIQQKNTTYHINMSVLDKVVLIRPLEYVACVLRGYWPPGVQEAFGGIYSGGTGSMLCSQYVMRMLYDSQGNRVLFPYGMLGRVHYFAQPLLLFSPHPSLAGPDQEQVVEELQRRS